MLCKRKIANTDIEMIYIEDAIIGKALSATGYWERNLTEYFKQWVISQTLPFTFIDIGAHAGYFSLLAAGLNKKCTVVAFEPNPIQNAILNLNADKYDKLFVIEAAYSKNCWKQKLMYGSLNNTGDNGLTKSDYKYYAKQESLHGANHNDVKFIKSISLVKIDTQGNEFGIFKELQKEFKYGAKPNAKVTYITEITGPNDPFARWLKKKKIHYIAFAHNGAPNPHEADIVFEL